jgi:hypothetical protein
LAKDAQKRAPQWPPAPGQSLAIFGNFSRKNAHAEENKFAIQGIGAEVEQNRSG